MSTRISLALRWTRLSLVILAFFVATACEKVEDDPDLAMKIQTAALSGLSEGQQVTLKAGVGSDPTQTWTATVGADRLLTFDIEEADQPHPRDFLWMTASYVHSEDITLDFTVLVGEYRELQQAADVEGVVTPDEYGRVLFSAVRVVESVMLRQENNGELIRDASALAEGVDNLDGAMLLDSATALEVAFTTDVPGFPESLTATEIIVNDQSLVDDLILTAGESHPDALAAARSHALRDTSARVGWDTGTDLGSRLALFQPGYPGVTGEVLHFDSATSGRIGAPEGVDSFSWQLNQGVVELDFAGDISWEGTEAREDEDGETMSFAYHESYESASIHRIVEGQSSDLVLMQVRFRREFEDESLDTEFRDVERVFTAWRGSFNNLPTNASGSWAYNLPRRDSSNSAGQAQLDSNGMGEVLSGDWMNGETINWTSSGGSLRFEHPDGDLRIRFLREADAGWIAMLSEFDNTGTVVRESVDLVARGDTPLPSDLEDRYVPYGGPPDPTVDPSPLVIQLGADGEALEQWGGDGIVGEWSRENGDLVIRSCLDPEQSAWVGLSAEPNEGDCDRYRRRQWTLVSVTPSDEQGLYMVLESFRYWVENSVNEEPDGDDYRQLYFLEREIIESDSEAEVEIHRRTRPVYVPGRGHPGLSGADS